MLKRIALIVLLAVPMLPEPWGGKTFTVAAGTAARIVSPVKTLATQLTVQMDVSATGIGYLLYAPPSVTCSNGGAGTTLVTKIIPGSGSNPGVAVTIPLPASPSNPKIDIQNYCLDGSHTGDGIIVSWNLSN